MIYEIETGIYGAKGQKSDFLIVMKRMLNDN
jgi:hypothetical protein